MIERTCIVWFSAIISARANAASHVRWVDCIPNLRRVRFCCKDSLIICSVSFASIFCPMFNISNVLQRACSTRRTSLVHLKSRIRKKKKNLSTMYSRALERNVERNFWKCDYSIVPKCPTLSRPCHLAAVLSSHRICGQRRCPERCYC